MCVRVCVCIVNKCVVVLWPNYVVSGPNYAIHNFVYTMWRHIGILSPLIMQLITKRAPCY